MIQRRFVNLPRGQLHLRERAGEGVPLILLHAAPGSALMLAPLQERLNAPTLAPDMPGMGDSDIALLEGKAEPDADDYASAVTTALKALAIGACDVYGTLSGVRVALALAARADSPVRRLVLDGIGVPKPEDLPALLEDYAPAFTPDINGTHFLTLFQLCRDQYLFYPWNQRDAAHRRPTGLPSAEALHLKSMEALKSMAGFRPLIRAAFRYPVAEALKNLKQPALISPDGAAIRPDFAQLTEPPAEPLTATVDNLDRRAAQINAFLR